MFPFWCRTWLVCHGLLGAMHQLTGTEFGEKEPMSGPAHAVMEGPSSPPTSHVGTGEATWGNILDYAAAILFPAPLMDHTGGYGAADGGPGLANQVGALIFVVVAVLWSLLQAMPGWRRVPLPKPLFRKPRPTATLRRLSAPAVSTLQVFRL